MSLFSGGKKWSSIEFLVEPDEFSSLIARANPVIVQTQVAIPAGQRITLEALAGAHAAYLRSGERSDDLTCKLLASEEMIVESRAQQRGFVSIQLTEPPVYIEPVLHHANAEDGSSTPLVPGMVLQYPKLAAFTPDYLWKETHGFTNAGLFNDIRAELLRITKSEKVAMPRHLGWTTVVLRVSEAARPRLSAIIRDHPALIRPISARLLRAG